MIRTAILFTLCAAPAWAEPLTVYAPDYFASEWGPGPAIAEAFREATGEEIAYVTGDVLPRLLLEGRRTRADVAIGLTSDQTARARGTGLFAPHGVDAAGLTMPVVWTDDVFLPFNWSQLAFVYDADLLADAPDSFQALLAAPRDLRLAIQDPRSSESGLALALWVDALYGEAAPEAWAALAPKVATVTPGWSESYGLFTSGEVDMVLSFTTSPAYHLIAEGDRSVRAAIFPEGHYALVEVAARLAGTDQPELAQLFMDFVLSPEFQRIVPEGNWSFPARLPPEELPDAFAALDLPASTLLHPEAEAAARREPAIAAFLEGMGR